MDSAFLSAFHGAGSDDAYRYLGCHRAKRGFLFRVWAPNAKSVRLIGSFNGWNTSVRPMKKNGQFWEQTVSSARVFDTYKYYIERPDGTFTAKCDPYAFHTETRPGTASKVYCLPKRKWRDEAYLRRRASVDPLRAPVNVYEVHPGSWRRYPDGNFFTYRDLARELIPYVKEMGFTHIEFLPITEHPLDMSWGYQTTGWFAPTSRFGTPEDFRFFVEEAHRAGIGVILDFVGAHFPKDECGLYEFDGTCLYESPDPVKREHPEWGTRVFDYGRQEVRSFLFSSVCFWLREYHIDGIRFDAVASMIYLDYARKPGEWTPNEEGGNVDPAAVSLLREINRRAFAVRPDVMMIAEESTAFANVTRPGYEGGLGFNFKWDMGWMHDTLDYMEQDPLMRSGAHEKLTFSLTYAFSENYVLPFSHDEVVHGKRSVIGRMPGGYEDKFANLRVLYGFMFAHPGKKLNFMGNELAQFIEWDYDRELDWLLLGYEAHRRFRDYFGALSRFYLSSPSLWEDDLDWDGFRWLRVDDRLCSVIAFLRRGTNGEDTVCVCNFTPVLRSGYRIGLPFRCTLKPVFSSDETAFGGSGTPLSPVKTEPIPSDLCPQSVSLTLPPLSAVFYRVTRKRVK